MGKIQIAEYPGGRTVGRTFPRTPPRKPSPKR